MYAIIDTETSGLPDYKLPADDPSQPRLAQLAVILTNHEMKVLSEFHYFVRPDGWEMAPEATAINGLTTERLLADGAPLADVLDHYEQLIHDGYEILAYGAQFDCKILRGEFRRAGRDDLFAKTRNYCAMRACMSFGVKNEGGRGWPRLEHACRHFGIDVEPKPHNAVHGARACLGVVRALREGGVLIEPSVHYAKEKPGAAA